MEPIATRILAAVALAAALAGCGLTTKENGATHVEPGIQTGAIPGSVTGTGGNVLALTPNASHIQVVMFVSETCSVCRGETKGLVADLGQRGTPSNVDFLSVVVGAIPEDAQEWRDDVGVKWSVGVDPGDSLFRGFCPNLQTPCVVLRNPILNQYKALSGAHPLSEWESFTGAWSYGS